jgi:AmmeMemoRadiSam system protein B
LAPRQAYGKMLPNEGREAMSLRPKLRDLEVNVVNEAGQQGILLRDPLMLSERAIFLPMALAPLLELCDGTRDEAGLRASLAVRAGVQIGPTTLEQILAQLDEALLLDNDRFADAYASALSDFRAAAYRRPVLAGRGYPSHPEELEVTLRSYAAAAPGAEQASSAPGVGRARGLISPHIDYERGGQVYAGVWQRAEEEIKNTDLAIVLGTDHIGNAKLTLTHQSYATPWGVLPTADDVVDEVARAVGPESVFGKELHHRGEHSIELAVVWLHFLLGESKCSLVPILCGGFEAFIAGETSPGEDAELEACFRVLKEAASSHRTMIIAAGDLAHVGPAFGDGYRVDIVQKARLRRADEDSLKVICAGDEEGLLEQVRAEGDRRRICGLPPIYLALRLLGETEGTLTGYAQCPADQQGTSFVSICGVLLS